MNLHVRNIEEASVQKNLLRLCLSDGFEAQSDGASQTLLFEVNVKIGQRMGGDEVVVVR